MTLLYPSFSLLIEKSQKHFENVPEKVRNFPDFFRKSIENGLERRETQKFPNFGTIELCLFTCLSLYFRLQGNSTN